MRTMVMKREIAFIDRTVPDLDTLIAGLRPDVEGIVLDRSKDALEQIAGSLRDRSEVDAIHIVAHGRPGEVSFGSGPLSLESMAEHAGDLQAIGRSLAADGDL